MPTLRFTGKIKIQGINPYVLVSSARAADLKPGWRKPMPVCVRIDGKPKTPWRINMMPTGKGSFYLYLHGDVREASGTKVGDSVDVEVRFDPTYRSGPAHPVPTALVTELRKNPKAKAAWDALIPSRQKEVLRYLAHLKTPEARGRNLARVMRALSGERERFMARTWKDGA